MHAPLKYKKDGKVYKLGWIIENRAINMIAEEVTFTFMQHATKAILQNAVIRCFLYVSNMGYVVIKGVPTSAGMGKKLFQAIKRENTDKKCF